MALHHWYASFNQVGLVPTAAQINVVDAATIAKYALMIQQESVNVPEVVGTSGKF